MRQIYKDTVIGLILASFTFSPAAFAKPRANQVRVRSKAPAYAKVAKTIKQKRKNLKVSDFIESSKGMFKNRAYKDIRKMALPYWDKKFDQLKIGKNYYKMTFKGESVFVRFVDRGKVAFMINNQPMLWSDFMSYGKAKKRFGEILDGKKAKKVSWMESIVDEIFPSAFAKMPPAKCRASGGEPREGKIGDILPKDCICREGMVHAGESLRDTDHNLGTKYEFTPADGHEHGDAGFCGGPAKGAVTEQPPVKAEKKKFNFKWLLWGGFAVLALWLLLKKKKKKTPGVTTPPQPPGWSREGTGCITPGANDRGTGLPECTQTTPAPPTGVIY